MDLKKLVFPCILILFSLAGCSKHLKPDGFPPLYPASVRVIQDGKPLEGAQVCLFRKDDTEQKWGIIGETDSNGIAVLVTHGKFYGVPEGEYLVLVTKQEDVSVSHRGDGSAVDSFTLVEEQYGDKEKTSLQFRVQKRGKNYEEIDVGKAVRTFLGRSVA